MAKRIEFDYDGQHYTLGFSRATIQKMENSGFVISNLTSKPSLTIPAFFAGSFLLCHKREKQEKIQEIYKHMTNKDKLIEALTEAYYEALDSLMEEPEEDDPKKIEW